MLAKYNPLLSKYLYRKNIDIEHIIKRIMNNNSDIVPPSYSISLYHKKNKDTKSFYIFFLKIIFLLFIYGLVSLIVVR